jgi:2-(1,2-epoxy-1,2-dihydrophenyl)acetyl-CoA isomerase
MPASPPDDPAAAEGTSLGDPVNVTDHGSVRVLSINNRSKRNALDDRVRQGLITAVDEAAADDGIRVITLTGEGGTFCAGGDLPSMPTSDPDEIRARVSEMHRLILALIRTGKPVVAAVEGYAFGSGLSIVAACDIVVAADNARFGAPFGRVGLVADCGLLWTLPRRVGVGKARTLALTSSSWPADTALQNGLVDTVVAPDLTLQTALATASALAEGAPLSAAATKRLLSEIESLVAFLDRELDEQTALLQSADFIEGRNAFLERRDARFTGA